MQRIFEYIGLITLMCFSFFVTEKTSKIAKNVDEIMINIQNNASKQEMIAIDAIIDNNTIIPGVCGRKVNIDRSYKEMKKIGIYDEKLYQYDYFNPNISISNNYDKLIISGNPKNNFIYFFIELNTDNKELLSKYNFSNYNFIVSSDFYLNNISLIKKLQHNKNSIILSPTTFKKYKKISNDYLEKNSNKIYCYNIDNNESFLKMCSSNKSGSIGKIQKINSNYLLNIKKNLKPGIFLQLSLNKELINNLEMIENYIDSKGIIMSSIDYNLKEC